MTGASRRRSKETVGGRRNVLEAIRAGRAAEVIMASDAKRTQGLRDVLDAAHAGGVRVTEAPRVELDAFAPDHAGVVATIKTDARPRELSEAELAAFPFSEDAVVVVLDGVEDPQNLGAAARSAEAAGAEALVTRIRRAAGPTPAAVRASAGALHHLPHARVANIARAVERLRSAGFFVAGLDGQAERTIYEEPCPEGKVAIVVGSEASGMSRLTRERCDALLRLPMRGRVTSLNASASLAAALFAYVIPSRR